LEGHGLDVGSKTTNRDLLDEKVKAFKMERSGMELQKVVKLPLDAIGIHLFGEALVSISHLIYRHETEYPRATHVYSLIPAIIQTLIGTLAFRISRPFIQTTLRFCLGFIVLNSKV